MKESFKEVLYKDLVEEMERHPVFEAQDIVKFIFQGLKGNGHALNDFGKANEFIQRERENLENNPSPEGQKPPLYEYVGPDWARLNLEPAIDIGLGEFQISAMMFQSNGQYREKHSGHEVYEVCVEFSRREEVESRIDKEVLRKAAESILNESEIPGHSETYKSLYRPAYRLVPSFVIPLLEPVQQIQELVFGGKKHAIITVDGHIGSGKTTVAELLDDILPLDSIVVHTDEYVVPLKYKNQKRLAIPGGNCDWERLVKEVLKPWRSGRKVVLKPYSWSIDDYLPEEKFKPLELLIVEGSYSTLPELREYADLSYFVETPEQVRMEQLKARESETSLQNFYQRWIPLEDTYLTTYGIPDENCIKIKMMPGWPQRESTWKL